MSLTIQIHDLQTNLLADISTISLERSMTRALNQARSFQITALANNPEFTDIAADGYRILRKGNRKLLVWENDEIIFHGRIFSVERTGDGTSNRVTITAFDALMELGYESDDRAGRPVRDATGNFINPKFTSSVFGQTEISGPDLIYQALVNSQQTGTESDPNPGEGPLPIDLTTGTFDFDVPPAIDLRVADSLDWPALLGDFIQQLTLTGVCDIDARPVDPTEGLDPYVMVVLSAQSSIGTDRSGTVHFDYWTGDRNASGCRHVEDFSTICNKLYDYLGPRRSNTRWAGNITPGSPGTTVDPTASRTLYGGEFMWIRIFDSIGNESSARPLYLALWNAEQGYRVEPRDLLFVTPAQGAAAIYQPPQDYDVGDSVGISTGAEFGIELAGLAQRVYGYTKTWTREDVAQVSQLLTSADGA